jgi:hypothetical protein
MSMRRCSYGFLHAPRGGKGAYKADPKSELSQKGIFPLFSGKSGECSPVPQTLLRLRLRPK